MFSFFKGRKHNARTPSPPPVPEEEVHVEVPEPDPVDEGTLRLPTTAHVKAMFKTLKDFTLSFPFYPSATDSPMIPTNDPIDLKLANNIRKMFSSEENTKFNIEKITDILSNVVDKDNMSLQFPKPRQNQNASEKKSNNTMLKAFYPHLIGLIIAVSTHTKNLTNLFTIQGKLPNMQEKNRLHTWIDVLNKLHDIRSIILYHNSQENNFLTESTATWEKIVADRNSTLHNLTSAIQTYDININQLEQKINEKNKEISRIQAQYQDTENSLELIQSQKVSLQEKLSQLQDVSAIVDYNMTSLDPSSATTSAHFFTGNFLNATRTNSHFSSSMTRFYDS